MIRTRLCLFALLLTPLLVYWPSIFTDYGFRGDYANMREAREEPGKIVRFTSSQGRPLYGALLETSFSKVEEVATLQVLRLANVLLLTLLGLVLWRQLYQSGWKELEAAAVGLGITLLPAAQVTSNWATAWPQTLALLLAAAGFSAIETELERGGMKRAIALVGGVLIYALAALVYQSNAVFAVVPIAAVLLVRAGRGLSSDRSWFALHVSALLTGLLLSYLAVNFLFSSGLFRESSRMLVEHNPFTKLVWFLWQPLPNSLALYFLRDDFYTGAVLFWLAALGIGAFIGWGSHHELTRAGETARKRCLLCLCVLPFIAEGVSLIAAERSTAYRTIFALAGLVIVMVIHLLRSLQAAQRIKTAVYYAGLGLLVLTGVVAARVNSASLIAVPQSYEWEMVRGAVFRADFKGATRVFLIRPALADRATKRVFGDEFGSLSSSSGLEAEEMFKAALHERFPDKLPKGGSYTFASGPEAPEGKAYDLVIDMRKLKERRAP